MLPENDFRLYASVLRDREHAIACSRWYRTFLSREFLRWLRENSPTNASRSQSAGCTALPDPVLTPTLLRDFDTRVDDFNIELVPGVGHWIAEQQPELVLARLRAFLHESV